MFKLIYFKVYELLNFKNILLFFFDTFDILS